MLQIKNLSFRYNKKKENVITDLNLSINQGGIYGLLGSNGAGKSTLLYLISGLLTPSSGSVTLNDINTRLRYPSTISNLFIVPEEFDLPSLSLLRFVDINNPFYPHFSKEEMLSHLELFEINPDVNIGKLSMGQKKKVMLSFAMACNTGLLILDEPTNGLDIPGKDAFRRFIASTASNDRIVIISTHQVREVSQILDHIIIIDNNSLLLDSSVNDIQSHLRFVNTNNRELVDQAIYIRTSPMGNSLILPNTSGEETDIDLELLFSFVHDDPKCINEILK